MRINLKSVLTSGLLCGLLIIISALTMIPVVGNEMDAVLADRGLPPLSTPAMIYFCCLSLSFGIMLVWLYAFAKVQLGPGIKTAVKIAVFFWVLTYLIANVSMIAYGFMPVRLTMIGTIWGLGELIVAAIVASKLYKDPK